MLLFAIQSLWVWLDAFEATAIFSFLSLSPWEILVNCINILVLMWTCIILLRTYWVYQRNVDIGIISAAGDWSSLSDVWICALSLPFLCYSSVLFECKLLKPVHWTGSYSLSTSSPTCYACTVHPPSTPHPPTPSPCPVHISHQAFISSIELLKTCSLNSKLQFVNFQSHILCMYSSSSCINCTQAFISSIVGAFSCTAGLYCVVS